jgi:hypothetical protein
LNTKTENLLPVQLSRLETEEAALTPERPAEQKKTFVEPAVSFPIDVLEATTFFQLTDSGPTT